MSISSFKTQREQSFWSRSFAQRREGSPKFTVFERLGIWFLGWLLVSNLLTELGSVNMLQPYTNPIESARVVASWQTDPDAEVLVLGASLVQRAFSPKVIRQEAASQIGVTVSTLNCGIPRLHSKEAQSYLRTLLSHSRPRLVVYGTSIRECTHYPSSASRYFRVFASPVDVCRSIAYGPKSYSNLAESIGALFRPSNLPFQWAAIYGFRLGEYLGLTPTNYDRELEQMSETEGWVSFRRRGSRQPHRPEFSYSPSLIAWENLKRMKQIADSQGIPLVILLMPVGTTHFTSEATSRFGMDLRRFCFEEDIDFFDMNQQPFLPKSSDYEGDAIHLLTKGAKKFSRQFTRFALLPILNGEISDAGIYP